jgi:hypothetical protein|tara:strand:+ start:10195 stop:10416 length:222 start_codon:yes stop_codon:yes gene_type:complete
MGRLKNFLIEEQMRLSGDWREQNHYEYLAWRKQLQEQRQYEEHGLSHKHGGKNEDRRNVEAECHQCSQFRHRE